MMVFPVAITQIENDADRAFMEEVYIQYHSLYYRVAKGYVSTVDVEEIIQSSSLKMCENIPGLRAVPSDTLPAYTISIVRHTAFDFLRQQFRLEEYLWHPTEEELDDVAIDVSMEEAVLRRAYLSDITVSISRLPRREKGDMQMRFFDNMNTREIAGFLGIKECTIRVIIKRGRAHLIQDLIQKKWIDADEKPTGI